MNGRHRTNVFLVVYSRRQTPSTKTYISVHTLKVDSRTDVHSTSLSPFNAIKTRRWYRVHTVTIHKMRTITELRLMCVGGLLHPLNGTTGQSTDRNLGPVLRGTSVPSTWQQFGVVRVILGLNKVVHLSMSELHLYWSPGFSNLFLLLSEP